MYVNPLLKKLRNSNGEATMNEEMVIVFFGLLTKRAKPTILPTTSP
jgi:hypothetical protein